MADEIEIELYDTPTKPVPGKAASTTVPPAPTPAPSPAARQPVPVVDPVQVAQETEPADAPAVQIRALPDGRLALTAPYLYGQRGREAREWLKRATGARWDGGMRVWVIPARTLPELRTWLQDHYQTDGGAVVGDTPSLTRAVTALAAADPRFAPTAVTAPAPVAALATPPSPAPSTEVAGEAPSAAATPRVQGVAGLAAASAARRAAGLPSRVVPAAAEATATMRESEQMAAALTDGQLVAGARADGQGALLGWDGRGEATRATLVAALAAAGCPADWAPKAKSPQAHAGAAIGKLSREGLIPRVARDLTRADKARGVSARWIVGRANYQGDVGEALGRIALTAELVNGRLALDGEQVLVTEVTAEYERLAAGDVYAAADVTAWLAGILRGRWYAVRLAQAWYVRAGHVAQAEALCTAVSEVWGVNWLLPALPVATSAQLRAGLARGLTQEADDVLADLERQRKVAADANRADVGPRAAGTLLVRLRAVAERASQYAVILGETHVAQVRRRLAEAMALVEPLCDGTSLRGAMLEMD